MTDKPNVLLSLAPEIVSNFRVRHPQTHEPVQDELLDQLEQSLAFGQTRARELSDLVDAVRADRTSTPGAAAIKIRGAALKLGEAAAKKLDTAKGQVEKDLDAIAEGTAAPLPPRDALAAQLEAEVRARFAAMSHEESKKAWADALRAEDELIMGAILRAPAMLSGMTDAELELRRHAWRVKKFPEVVDREKRLTRALEAAERAGDSLINYVEAIASGPGAEAEKAAAHAAEMLKHAEATT